MIVSSAESEKEIYLMIEMLFITDYVCPYCLVEKVAIEQALEELGMEADITYQPMELTEEPKERVDTYSDPKRREGYKVLYEPCKKLGLEDMKLPPKVVPRPYTRLAFEGWYYACEQGKGDAYADKMYRAYFMDEKDIGEMDVLVELAESIGLAGKEYRAALESGKYTEKEKAAVRYARNVLKPSCIPTIYINGEKVELKEYTKEEMIQILEKYHD